MIVVPACLPDGGALLVTIMRRAALYQDVRLGDWDLMDGPSITDPELLPSPQGVRSVAVQGGSVLSFGTAAGRLCFHDLRQGRGSTHDDTRSGAPLLWPSTSLMRVADTGAGWVDQNETYWDHFAHSRVPHACYAHAWDACGSRLFACGGPLAFGMRGCYLGLWH